MANIRIFPEYAGYDATEQRDNVEMPMHNDDEFFGDDLYDDWFHDPWTDELWPDDPLNPIINDDKYWPANKAPWSYNPFDDEYLHSLCGYESVWDAFDPAKNHWHDDDSYDDIPFEEDEGDVTVHMVKKGTRVKRITQKRRHHMKPSEAKVLYIWEKPRDGRGQRYVPWAVTPMRKIRRNEAKAEIRQVLRYEVGA